MGQIKVTLVTNELYRVVKAENLQGEFPKFTAAQVHECEFHLLDKLGCDLVVFHPYRDLMSYCRDTEVDESILQSAWNITNDSYRTDVSLLYPPHLIALASLYVASVYKKKDLRKWFDKLNVNLDEVRDIVKHVIDMYETDAAFDEERRNKRRRQLENRFLALYAKRYRGR